jgi:hypothetical protein
MRPPRTSDYAKSVFINCPFDKPYERLLFGIIFAIHYCGFAARCALEKSNSGPPRIAQIVDIIRSCKFGIHDISRTELGTNGFPRFNMPLELGLFLGASEFDKSREKICLILDKETDRYKVFCSDIAGQDIKSHDNSVRTAIKVIRDWLQEWLEAGPNSPVLIPDGGLIYQRFCAFLRELPSMCKQFDLKKSKLIYIERQTLVVAWIARNDWRPKITAI